MQRLVGQTIVFCRLPPRLPATKLRNEPNKSLFFNPAPRLLDSWTPGLLDSLNSKQTHDTFVFNDRPSPRTTNELQSDLMGQYSIGVDLGGTNLRAAAISSSGEVMAKISGAAHLSQGRAAVLEDMVDSIKKLRAQCGTHDLTGVGIGVPGFIIIEKGIIVGS